MRRIKAIEVIAAVLSVVAFAAPAAAQNMSEGFEFLKAVKDRDGTKVTAADEFLSQLVKSRSALSSKPLLLVALASGLCLETIPPVFRPRCDGRGRPARGGPASAPRPAVRAGQ